MSKQDQTIYSFKDDRFNAGGDFNFDLSSRPNQDQVVVDSFFPSLNDIPPSPILPNQTIASDFGKTIINNDFYHEDDPVVIESTKRKDVAKESSLIETSYSNIYSIISLLNEHVISHPFVVIRRQAQVNNRSNALHLTPFTIVPYMIRLQQKQGISTFFKGLPSVLINYVILIGSESFLYNNLQFPIEYSFDSIAGLFSFRFIQHLTLKGLSILFVTPFICTSSVETVQSLIVGELPYPLEHIKEGFLRILHSKKDRKLPFYLLAGPSIAYHLCYYVIFSIIRENLLQYFNDYKSKPDLESIILTKQKLIQSNYLDDESKSKIYAEEYKKLQKSTQQDEKSIINDLKCSLIAHFLTDTITYPFQNVLYRIFLQGTRTLIDNVDGRTACH
ncbi:Solute carrier family 25 member 46 [Sarcoptes scabiei]|uniref:Solute carrier family 25 member 46 n=1 Tax=Sarcoptes scabiei TaxID=52283 RepID=A0A834RD52_SARSC|nr:Solute carrier family 25 member 46 [Sarcoptes scabiei]